MKLNELTKLEMPIAFNIGILIGVLASWVFLVFFTNLAWWVKLTSSIGEFSIIGVLIFGIIEAFKARNNYITMMKEMGDKEILPEAIAKELEK